MDMDPQKEPRFEDVYPEAPFSELVRLTIALPVILRKAASQLQELSWSRFRLRRKGPA